MGWCLHCHRTRAAGDEVLLTGVMITARDAAQALTWQAELAALTAAAAEKE